MAKMNSKFKYQLDADPSITFRAVNSAPVTATASSTALILDQLHGWWTSGELADQEINVIVNVTAVDHTTGDETYVLTVEAGPVGFATSVIVGEIAAVPGTGQYVVNLDMDTVRAVKADAAALRITATLAGTTPSITYNAWIGGGDFD